MASWDHDDLKDTSWQFDKLDKKHFMKTNDINDFGFTIEDPVQKVDDRAERMFNAIKPLLDNLRQNPKVDTIKWPDRVKKIDEFEQKLLGILDTIG